MHKILSDLILPVYSVEIHLREKLIAVSQVGGNSWSLQNEPLRINNFDEPELGNGPDFFLNR